MPTRGSDPNASVSVTSDSRIAPHGSVSHRTPRTVCVMPRKTTDPQSADPCDSLQNVGHPPFSFAFEYHAGAHEHKRNTRDTG